MTDEELQVLVFWEEPELVEDAGELVDGDVGARRPVKILKGLFEEDPLSGYFALDGQHKAPDGLLLVLVEDLCDGKWLPGGPGRFAP